MEQLQANHMAYLVYNFEVSIYTEANFQRNTRFLNRFFLFLYLSKYFLLITLFEKEKNN